MRVRRAAGWADRLPQAPPPAAALRRPLRSLPNPSTTFLDAHSRIAR